MYNSRPKQFIEVNGKPIIIYTLEVFEQNPQIDAIVVVCLEEWIPLLRKMLKRYSIEKVVRVVPGGKEGQESIYRGLCAAEEYAREQNVGDPLVLIHDAVRPLLDQTTLNNSIEVTRQQGNCITVGEPTETILMQSEGQQNICVRDELFFVRAPQVFVLKDIIALHRRAQEDGKTYYKDCCSMLTDYGVPFQTLTGRMFNIKITHPSDLLVFKSIIAMQETRQMLGM